MSTTTETDQQDLQNFIKKFVKDNMQRCKEGIVCDEQLMVDLIKLKNKTKKAFPKETLHQIMLVEPKHVIYQP